MLAAERPMTIGVAMIKGKYDGKVKITDIKG